MHPLNDHAWQSDTRMFFFLFMDSQGTVNGTFYDGQVFFRAKLQLVADPFPIFTFLPHDFWIEVVFHGQATNLDKLYHDGQAGNRPFILFCVLELGDGEIGNLMGMSRSAVQRHRTKTLNELRKKLKAHLPEGG